MDSSNFGLDSLAAHGILLDADTDSKCSIQLCPEQHALSRSCCGLQRCQSHVHDDCCTFTPYTLSRMLFCAGWYPLHPQLLCTLTPFHTLSPQHQQPMSHAVTLSAVVPRLVTFPGTHNCQTLSHPVTTQPKPITNLCHTLSLFLLLYPGW
jgi:hypothetical protein